MAKTLSQLEKQIAQLQREADALRKKEVAGVIARIQEAIRHYGLTPDELFGAQGRKRGAAGGATTKTKASAKAARKAPSPVKYRDDAGHTWTGHGKRPNWFKEALAQGKTLQDLEVKA